MAKLMLAVALLDIAAHGVKGGQVLEADAATIAALQKAGEVDPHKDALAYAKAQGAAVVRSSVELQEEAAKAAADAKAAQTGAGPTT